MVARRYAEPTQEIEHDKDATVRGSCQNHRFRNVATSRAGGPNTNSPVNSRYTRLAGCVSVTSGTGSWSIISDSYRRVE